MRQEEKERAQIIEKLSKALTTTGWEKISVKSNSFSRWKNTDGWTIDLHENFMWINSPHLITTFDYDMIDGISDEAVVIDLETILYFSKEMN